MINWPTILNNAVITLEVLSAACLIFISFKARHINVYVFAMMSALVAGLELASKIAYATHHSADFINSVNNIVLHVAMMATLAIYGLLLRRKSSSSPIAILVFTGMAACLMGIIFSLCGMVKEAMYTDQLSQVLLLIIMLIFVWQRLNIRYNPERYDDFWLWVSIAILFDTVTGIPFSVILDYLIAHFSEFSKAQIDRISNLKYLTSCVYYLLLIRASYEYR